MGCEIVRTPLYLYTCDWCNKVMESVKQELPEGWEKNCGASPSESFCSNMCSRVSERVWEDGYDIALNAQCDYWEEERRKLNARPRR